MRYVTSSVDESKANEAQYNAKRIIKSKAVGATPDVTSVAANCSVSATFTSASYSMSPFIFRLLLTASLILEIFGSSFNLLLPWALPEGLSSAYASYHASLSTPLVILLAGPIAVLISFVAFLGLFSFRPWAPRLAVISTALILIIDTALSANISVGWSVALRELSSILWGVVLAVVYFSPIKERFIAGH